MLFVIARSNLVCTVQYTVIPPTSRGLRSRPTREMGISAKQKLDFFEVFFEVRDSIFIADINQLAARGLSYQ